jgi:hypothetical protein
MLVGPLKTHFYLPTAKLEAKCHRCGWSDFKWTEQEAREAILRHLDYAHINPPKPINLTAAQMPGR